MSSEMPSFYSFKMGECIQKWKKVIFVILGTILIFLVLLLVIIATGADNGALTATIFGNKQFIQSLTKPYGKVAGSTTLNKAFNLLSGRGFDTAYANSIGEFTISEGKMVTVSGTTSYEPDQISIVANPLCDYYHNVTEEYIAGSISIEAIQAKQFSFDGNLYLIEDDMNSNEMTEKSPLGTQLTIMFGNTQVTGASLSAKGALYTYGFSLESGARLLTTAVDWDRPTTKFNYNKNFIRDMKSLGDEKMSARKRNKKVISFINKYGTHVIERAEFGAYCFANIGIASGVIETERAAFRANSSYFDAMTSFGFLSASESYSVGVAIKSSFGFNYEIASAQCDGLLKVNPCHANMQTGIDEPVLISCKPKWIFNINIFGESDSDSESEECRGRHCSGGGSRGSSDGNGKRRIIDIVRKNAYKTLKQYFKMANECSEHQCNGVGYCIPDSEFWDYGLYKWNGAFDDFTTFFKSGLCVSD